MDRWQFGVRWQITRIALCNENLIAHAPRPLTQTGNVVPLTTVQKLKMPVATEATKLFTRVWAHVM